MLVLDALYSASSSHSSPVSFSRHWQERCCSVGTRKFYKGRPFSCGFYSDVIFFISQPSPRWLNEGTKCRKTVGPRTYSGLSSTTLTSNGAFLSSFNHGDLEKPSSLSFVSLFFASVLFLLLRHCRDAIQTHFRGR